MNDINNDTKKSNNNAVSMKKALKSMFTRSSAENEDDSDGYQGERTDDQGNDDADVSDPSDDDDDEDEIETNINIYEDEAPFERNLRSVRKRNDSNRRRTRRYEAKKSPFNAFSISKTKP